MYKMISFSLVLSILQKKLVVSVCALKMYSNGKTDQFQFEMEKFFLFFCLSATHWVWVVFVASFGDENFLASIYENWWRQEIYFSKIYKIYSFRNWPKISLFNVAIDGSKNRKCCWFGSCGYEFKLKFGFLLIY